MQHKKGALCNLKLLLVRWHVCRTQTCILLSFSASDNLLLYLSFFEDSSTVHGTAATGATATRIVSTTNSTGTTRMLASRTAPAGQNLVTKLITFPSQSPMDSIKEWSVSTFKCTKQLINEKRGTCSITNDAQLQAEIEQLRDNRDKLYQMLRYGQQMLGHYSELVKTQSQLYRLMNEMSIKCITVNNLFNSNYGKQQTTNSSGGGSKQIVANFSSLSNNLSSSTTTTSPKHRHIQNQSDNLEDFLPVLNHFKSSNISLVDDFKKNAITLNLSIKNGEKLIAALNFYCSNLSTLITKTIEDTLLTVRQYDSARLEYDAERNSLNFTSPTAQTSITYSSDKLELSRIRYEQLREDVQIKMKFLEENIVKVMHKQLLLFNGAFASYSSGNTAALDSTLKQFSIR